MKPPITIVGAGQMGSMLGYRLLKKGYKIRIIEAGNKNYKDNSQTPWGWLRKFSLQSEAKKNLMSNEFPFNDIKKEINYTQGPLLITTKSNKTIDLWNDWIKNNNETDARILNPTDSFNQFNLNSDYFKNDGGTFICDSRDALIDYSLLNNYLLDYFENNPNCDYIENTIVNGIKINKSKATHILTNNDEIPIDKTFFCIGNQTSDILDYSIPIMKIKLPYLFIDNFPKTNYTAIWNNKSSLQYFKEGQIKIGSGTQSIFNFKNIKLINSLYFINMGLEGYKNIHYNGNETKLIENAIDELQVLNNFDYPKCQKIQTCILDVTPNFCPYIYFLPKANNILSISSFSGSGSMTLDNSFVDLLIESIEKNKLNKKLDYFAPDYSIINNLLPSKNKTAISSII